MINVLVGQIGTGSSYGGGGGGTFVVDASNNPILIAYGGGGQDTRYGGVFEYACIFGNIG